MPERAATIDDGPWAQFYVANWHSIAEHRDYWASFELPRMFGHLWSLAIEEQFYVVWPVIVGLIAWRSRNAHRAILITCVVASLASLAVMIALFDPDRSHEGVHRYRHTSQQPVARRAVRSGADACRRATGVDAPRRLIRRRHVRRRRCHRALVVHDRWTVVDMVVPRRAVRPFSAVGAAGRGLCDSPDRRGVALDRLEPPPRRRGVVVQPLPVALARLRPALPATHGNVGLAVAGACDSLSHSRPPFSRRC